MRVSLIDSGVSTGFAKMAAAAALAERAFDKLDGTNVTVRQTLRQTSHEVDNLGRSFRHRSTDIDQFSGRLTLALQGVGALGPALVPIGAVAVPAVAGLASQMGFAALGAGTLVAAFQGVGDAMKAVNEAALSPTAANLEKAREAMRLIGPDAREFVRAFQEFRPVLTEIRDSAAAGWFPGLTESLDHFAEIGPQIADIFEKIGRAGGDLIAGGAESLASGRWAEFLDFIEREAPSALEQLGRTVGDLTHGMAELWMAFDPLNEDFAGWLEGVASGFDDWASGLAATAGFQEFVAYLRETGPQVADAMGALANAVLQIAEAAAPLGGPVLEAIEGFANAVANIADSDLGTPILAGVAAMSAFRLATRAASTEVGKLVLGQRQMSLGFGRIGPAVRTFGTDLNNVARFGTLATDSSKRLQGQLAQFGKSAAVVGGFGIAATGAADGIGLTNTASLALLGTLGGPWGVALGAGAGLMLDMASAGEDLAAAIKTADAAAQTSDIDAMRVALEKLKEESDDNGFLGLGGLFEDVTGKSARAKEEIGLLTAAITYLEDTSGRLEGGDALAVLLDVGNRLPGSFLNAAGAVQELNDGLAELAGWLDKRAALRGFEDAMKELQRSLNAGEINKWAENVDAVGSSLIQVASQLRGPAKVTFIDTTIASLKEMAEGAGPKAAAEIQALIRQLRNLDGTEANPKIGADDREANSKTERAQRRLALLNAYKANPNLDLNDTAFLRAFGITKADLEWLDRKVSNPTVKINDQASGPLRNVKSLMDGLRDKSITLTTYLATVHTPKADGGYIAGPGTATSDSIPAMLSNGEFVMKAAAVQRYGIDAMYAMNEMRLAAGGLVDMTHAKRFAGGGNVGGNPTGPVDFGVSLVNEVERRRRATSGVVDILERERRERLKDLTQRQKVLQEELDAAREFRNSLRDASRSLRDSLADQFRGTDLFSAEDASFGSIFSGLKSEAAEASQFASMILRLKALGLDGPALQALIETGNLSLLQDFAAQGSSQLGAFESQFNTTQQQAQQVGQNASFAVFGTKLDNATAALNEIRDDYRKVRREVKEHERRIEQLQREETAATDRVANKVDKLAGNVANAGRR